jgi:hypothetical protein
MDIFNFLTLFLIYVSSATPFVALKELYSKMITNVWATAG